MKNDFSNKKIVLVKVAPSSCVQKALIQNGNTPKFSDKPMKVKKTKSQSLLIPE